MKYITVLIICVSIVDETYSCSRPALKSKEYELKLLKDSDSTRSSDIDYIKKLQDEIKHLKNECHEFKGVSIKCWDASYICNSKGYIPGCPCWKYAMEYENVTSARLQFKKFYPNGVNVTTYYYEGVSSRDTILEVCDYVSPPWPFYHIYDDNAGLAEFTHCIQDWRINCFCSSAQHSDDKASNDPTGNIKRDQLELCDNKIRHNCSNIIDGDSACSCWNYNISNVNSDVFNLSSLGNSKIENYLTPKVNVVICNKPYPHCSDENLAEGCPCWEYEVHEQGPSEIRYNYREIVRFGASNKTEEEKRFEHSIQKVCGHADPTETFNDFGDGFLISFTHCNIGGDIKCYCKLSAIAGVLQSAGCAYGQVNVNGRCVDRIDD